MTLFFSDKSSWGKTTIVAVLGTITINTDGTFESDNEDAKNIVDNISIFDNDNLPEITTDSIQLGEPVEKVNLDDYTADSDVVLGVIDTEILKKSLNFLTADQLIELIEKIGLTKPKSEKKHVLIQFVYKKLDATTWKQLLERIFDTFVTEGE